MGLDMFLTASKFISEYSEKELFEKINKITEAMEISPLKVSTISFDAIYWRKANAIHKWFVDNIQDGEDDCKRYYVETAALFALKEVIEKVLENPTEEVIMELLPPTDGFFFGSTKIDDSYFMDLKYTQEQLTKILSIPGITKNYDFYYQASW